MASAIVTYRPKKRTPQPKAQPAAITGSAIVTPTMRGARRAKPEPEDDAAAEARVRAFFARMVRPGGALPPGASE